MWLNLFKTKSPEHVTNFDGSGRIILHGTTRDFGDKIPLNSLRNARGAPNSNGPSQPFFSVTPPLPSPAVPKLSLHTSSLFAVTAAGLLLGGGEYLSQYSNILFYRCQVGR